MISERLALLRQAQDYFHSLLLGVVNWDDVVVDKPIPIPPVRGQREQGKVKDLVVAHFNGFRMELAGPFEDEDWPLGKVKVSRGGRSIEGRLDPVVWMKVAAFIKEQKTQGEDHGDVTAGTNWGR